MNSANVLQVDLSKVRGSKCYLAPLLSGPSQVGWPARCAARGPLACLPLGQPVSAASRWAYSRSPGPAVGHRPRLARWPAAWAASVAWAAHVAPAWDALTDWADL